MLIAPMAKVIDMTLFTPKFVSDEAKRGWEHLAW